MNQFIIYCVGDSHASFFSGANIIQPTWPEKSIEYYPFFRSARIGPVLAYNLCVEGTKTLGREKLFCFLKKRIPNDRILLSFGEIDCRAHLVKQSEMQKRSIDLVVNECVDRYFSVIKEIQSLNFELLVWNAIPSTTSSTIPDIKDPVFGTCLERNHAARLFNNYLSQLCMKSDIKFLSIFDKLVNSDGLTKMELYMDDVHLSQKAMPLILNALKCLYPNTSFSISPYIRVKQMFLILYRRVTAKFQNILE